MRPPRHWLLPFSISWTPLPRSPFQGVRARGLVGRAARAPWSSPLPHPLPLGRVLAHARAFMLLSRLRLLPHPSSRWLAFRVARGRRTSGVAPPPLPLPPLRLHLGSGDRLGAKPGLSLSAAAISISFNHLACGASPRLVSCLALWVHVRICSQMSFRSDVLPRIRFPLTLYITSYPIL